MIGPTPTWPREPRLLAVDNRLATATAEISLTLTNDPPLAALLSPNPYSRFTENDSIILEAAAFDPEGMNEAKHMLKDVQFATGPYDCVQNADAVVIITEWDQFRALDLDRIKDALKTPILVDLRNGKELWKGVARASTAEQQQNSGGGLAGILITALVNQVVNTLSDRGHEIAGIASNRLLSSNPVNGILPGPRARPTTPR